MLDEVLSAAAPYIAAERAVFDDYWDAPRRSAESDFLWIARQARKEFWDSFVDGERGLVLGPIHRLQDLAPRIDRGVSRHDVLAVVEHLRDELSHYVLFADLLDRLGGAPDPFVLKAEYGWPENDALAALRAAHRQEHGAVGVTACRITEGGFGTLFASGAALAGRGGLDDAIARVCATVGADEEGHRDVPVHDVERLTELVVAQQQARVAMRTAQFSGVR